MSTSTPPQEQQPQQRTGMQFAKDMLGKVWNVNSNYRGNYTTPDNQTAPENTGAEIMENTVNTFLDPRKTNYQYRTNNGNSKSRTNTRPTTTRSTSTTSTSTRSTSSISNTNGISTTNGFSTRQ